MAISQKMRFEVFKRDGFACKYCNKRPPETTLEVDHIIPVSEGGKDEINNLITSCFNCNRGKGKTSLNVLPNAISENLAILKEQQKQTKQYYKFLEKIAKQKDDDLIEIGHYFYNKFAKTRRTLNKYIFSDKATPSIKIFLKIFNKYEIMEAIDIAYRKFANLPYNQIDKTFRYMCGILHNWRKEKNGSNTLS